MAGDITRWRIRRVNQIDGLPGGNLGGRGPVRSGKSAEIVIERPILFHNENNVLNDADVTGGAGRSLGCVGGRTLTLSKSSGKDGGYNAETKKERLYPSTARHQNSLRPRPQIGHEIFGGGARCNLSDTPTARNFAAGECASQDEISCRVLAQWMQKQQENLIVSVGQFCAV